MEYFDVDRESSNYPSSPTFQRLISGLGPTIKTATQERVQLSLVRS